MLSLHKNVLAVMATNLELEDIRSVRCTNKQLHEDLNYSAKFASIPQIKNYPDEKYQRIVNELSFYASKLTDGFKGGNAKEIQDYVDAQNNKLTEEFKEISTNLESLNADFKIRKEALNALKTQDEKCESQSKRQLGEQDYRAQLTLILEDSIKVDAESEFAKNMVFRKRELLSLEHLVLLGEFSPGSQFSDIPYEQTLISKFQSRVEREVNDCGAANLDRATNSAQVALNNRSYLIAFTSSPDKIASYLKQLDDKLVSEVQEKYQPKLNDARCTIF
jgi:hypothetical protein